MPSPGVAAVAWESWGILSLTFSAPKSALSVIPFSLDFVKTELAPGPGAAPLCAPARPKAWLRGGGGGGDARKAAGRDQGFKGSDEEEGLKEDPSEFPRVPGSHGVPQS